MDACEGGCDRNHLSLHLLPFDSLAQVYLLIGHYGEKGFSRQRFRNNLPLCALADFCGTSKHVEVRGQALHINPHLSTPFETTP